MVTADLHCHTIHSSDSCNHLPWIINRCRHVGINCLAVTDHNCIEGAFRLKELAPFRIIVGEEIDTHEGEVIGLFLQERISPGKGLMRTVDDIKEQNGLVYLPHPLSISRESILNVPLIKSILWKIDIVEVFNSRTKRENPDNRWFQDWVESGRVIRAVGSDAHAPHEFGNVFIEMDDFETKEGFLQSLSKARFRIKKTSPMFRLIMNHKSRKIIRLYLSLFRSH